MTTTMAEQTAPPNTALSDLIASRRQEQRLSLRTVQDRTIHPDTGEPVIKYGRLNKLEKNSPGITPPTLEELEALAGALALPLGRLQDAAGAQFLGIETVWSESGEMRTWVELGERLSPTQRDAIFRLMREQLPPLD
ncbi:hypothetical protein QNO07_09685 [Streptomyces sp. 549]|uniref:hypothetical protein n=1 Tax=Streptomyces sp. 549 TaxID=3049076 RepID=UPI0024C29786|nr:hypothetical protein [Streptomyces sp. 549]MDK1473691.1 hypothetical protein [Streptomyces sp. 549]